ncbi:MAG TPA: alcohol dehydrogenase catalytic domain-containing protein [bacterium]|nr:alcohol dehydrogenase catalytic domain-containing protein [bacterium]
MKALVFDPTIPRFLATKALSAVSQNALWGAWAPLQYREIPDPPLPGDDWVRVRTILGGVCGSDLSAIHLTTSPAGSVLTSFPCVLGHENVGTIVEVGRGVHDLTPGLRVTVEPTLPCAARGIAPLCANCATGNYNICLRYTEGHISPGLSLGFCRDTGGSWGQTFVAHRSQILPVPDAVSDENALMVEPMAVALHPFLRHPLHAGQTVLVVGGGVIGQSVVAVLRALGAPVRIVVLAKYAFQEQMAQRLGADETVRLQRGDGHYEALASLLGAKLHRPLIGSRVPVGGGADVTVECVGGGRSIGDALWWTRPGGSMILLGVAALPRGVDWTPIWLNELRVLGSYIYSMESWEGRRVRTMDLVLDWIARGRLDPAPLVTHRFPLSDYTGALRTAMGKAHSQAFKVAFTP